MDMAKNKYHAVGDTWWQPIELGLGMVCYFDGNHPCPTPNHYSIYFKSLYILTVFNRWRN